MWPQTRPADHSILVTTRVHVSSVSYGLRIHPTRPPVNVGSPHPAGTCPLPTGQCADPSLGTKGPPCAVSRTSSRAQVSMTCQIERSTLSAGALEGRPPGCRRLPGLPSPPVKPMAAEQINDACTTADVPLI